MKIFGKLHVKTFFLFFGDSFLDSTLQVFDTITQYQFSLGREATVNIEEGKA